MATPTNDAKVVVKILKKNIFTCFSTPRAFISDKRSHFYNYLIERLLKKYNVTHKIAMLTTYKPTANWKSQTEKSSPY